MDHMDSEIQNWYLRLRTQTLDLVGDYAGKELFLLEGDSLLLQCFGDPKIEFEGKICYIFQVFLLLHQLTDTYKTLNSFMSST